MKEVTKGAFSFIAHKIKEFHLVEPPINESELSINFDASGIYHSNSSEYTLQFIFKAVLTNTPEVSFISATVEATFKFDNVKVGDEIPEYFYVNAIAIVFPYLRAFITTLTSVANLKPLVLPTYNLSNLSTLLKEKTTMLSKN